MLITSAKAQMNVVNIISSLSLEIHGFSSFPFPWGPVRHGPYFPLLVAQVVNGTVLRMRVVTPSPQLTAGVAGLYCAQKPYKPEAEPLQPFIFYFLPPNFDHYGWRVKKYPPSTGVKFVPSSAKIWMVISEKMMLTLGGRMTPTHGNGSHDLKYIMKNWKTNINYWSLNYRSIGLSIIPVNGPCSSLYCHQVPARLLQRSTDLVIKCTNALIGITVLLSVIILIFYRNFDINSSIFSHFQTGRVLFAILLLVISLQSP